ncbi:MAG: hypothetical protein FWD23_15900 [Oscillospiraceae bacterium]|nr:hypothetical protein [Oscillospiraceae bacterium]
MAEKNEVDVLAEQVASKEEDKPIKKMQPPKFTKAEAKIHFEEQKLKFGFKIIWFCVIAAAAIFLIDVLMKLANIQDSTTLNLVFDFIKTVAMFILGYIFGNKSNE